MKITSFRPLIMTNSSDTIEKLFEDFGFIKQHEKKDVTETKEGGFRMRDAEGNSVAIAQINQMPRDMTAVHPVQRLWFLHPVLRLILYIM